MAQIGIIVHVHGIWTLRPLNFLILLSTRLRALLLELTLTNQNHFLVLKVSLKYRLMPSIDLLLVLVLRVLVVLYLNLVEVASLGRLLLDHNVALRLQSFLVNVRCVIF